jgi:hypothetical protein
MARRTRRGDMECTWAVKVMLSAAPKRTDLGVLALSNSTSLNSTPCCSCWFQMDCMGVAWSALQTTRLADFINLYADGRFLPVAACDFSVSR